MRGLLDKYKLRARKGLGQHFLADRNILQKIIEAAELSSETIVLEIGPGLGILTRLLTQAAGCVVAVELDDRMVSVLRQELAHVSNLEVVQGDILKLDPAVLVRPCEPANQQSPRAYIVVANLPYYITSAAIRHMLEAKPSPHRLVLTVQREVAERIVAKPNQMSLLAVSVQFYGRPRIVARVPAGAFVPSPKVDSAVVRIDTFPVPPVKVSDAQIFFRVVRAGFGQKRKQLKNALASGLRRSTHDVSAALARAGVDPHRRAQTLTLVEWASLSRELASAGDIVGDQRQRRDSDIAD